MSFKMEKHPGAILHLIERADTGDILTYTEQKEMAQQARLEVSQLQALIRHVYEKEDSPSGVGKVFDLVVKLFGAGHPPGTVTLTGLPPPPSQTPEALFVRGALDGLRKLVTDLAQKVGSLERNLQSVSSIRRDEIDVLGRRVLTLEHKAQKRKVSPARKKAKRG